MNTARLLLALSLAGFVLACATPRPRLDPLRTINRGAHRLDGFNHRTVFSPMGRGLDAVTSDGARQALGRFFHNLSTPKLLVSDLLQGRLRAAGEDLSRFLVNSVVGLLGFVDVASSVGIPKHDEDLGQVVCSWRVPYGPYVYFPLLGPSSATEAVSATLDTALAPLDTLLPYFARHSGRAQLRKEIRGAFDALGGEVDFYEYERLSYQKNRVLQALEDAPFSPVSTSELAGERPQGSCGYRE